MPAAIPKQPMVGPFKPNQKPLHNRPGLYLRISKATGERVWSYFNGYDWFMYSNTKRGALSKYDRRKVSKFQNLPWYGMAQA